MIFLDIFANHNCTEIKTLPAHEVDSSKLMENWNVIIYMMNLNNLTN